jgi:hypothetical protein
MNSTSASIGVIKKFSPIFALDMPPSTGQLQSNTLHVEDESFVLEVTAEISALGFSQGCI